MKKISWEQYALNLARAASLRSEDPFKKVGACALRHDKSVAAVGYNGAPSGQEIDWSDRDERRRRVIHAEQNCLKYCRPSDVWLIAVTLLPCSSCMQTIASYNIKNIVYHEMYYVDNFAIQLAEEWDMKLIQLNNE